MLRVTFTPLLLALGALAYPLAAVAQAGGPSPRGSGTPPAAWSFSWFIVIAAIVVLAILFVALTGRRRRRRLPVDEPHAKP